MWKNTKATREPYAGPDRESLRSERAERCSYPPLHGK
uniref:Uncharacterized protein n=1 Tax=Tetraselmis sp. GSL018 TaxID=582737 RepID=A0A061R486_9CHLO